MMKAVVLFMLLGSTFARRNGRVCTRSIDPELQDDALENLLQPFIGGVVADDGTGSTMSVPTTTCMLRGVDMDWPHFDAVNMAQRRLLRRSKKYNVGFTVTNGDFGLLSKKRGDDFTCYQKSEVEFKFSKATMTNSTGHVFDLLPATADDTPVEGETGAGDDDTGDNSDADQDTGADQDDSVAVNDPRRQLGGRGQNDLPIAVVEFEQTTTNTDGVPVKIMVSVTCRAMYRKKRGEDCTLKGLDCRRGRYSYWPADDGTGTDDAEEEEEPEDERFRGMKCIAPENGEHWMSNWPECAAV